MRPLKQHILERLKVSKGHVSRMSLEEFDKHRNSLNERENNLILNSKYDMKDMFINWVEQMLIEDGVIDELPFENHMEHIIRFDGDILIDNIVDDEIDPPVSTELYLTWGEAYMRIVTYYVKYEVYMPLGYGDQTTSRQITYVSEKGTNQITIGEKSWEGTFGPLKKGAKLSLKATAISGGIWIDTDYYVKISVSRDKEPFVLKAEDRKIESGILEASYTINF